MGKWNQDCPITFCEIHRGALRYNWDQLKSVILQKYQGFQTQYRSESSSKLLCKSSQRPLPCIVPVVKADAYGHGMANVIDCLGEKSLNIVCVSDLKEGIALRELGFKKSIILLEGILIEDVEYLMEYDLVPLIYSYKVVCRIDELARNNKKVVDVHIKIDTGMGRLGVWHTEAIDFIKRISNLTNITISGIMTHFPVADTDRSFTQNQINIMRHMDKSCQALGLFIPFIHGANSVGFMEYDTDIFNLARVGTMLYGVYPSHDVSLKISLRPVMTVKSKIILLKKIKKGQGLSYGRTFLSKCSMTIATIPIGYNDGYFRCLSNISEVLINGNRCPVVGMVTMDQMMVDVSSLNDISVGEEVVVMGRQGKEEITAQDLALLANTIHYEILCNFGNSISRVFVN